MKRCPDCRRDYHDDSLLYCLEDGVALLQGPVTIDEQTTAILPESRAVGIESLLTGTTAHESDSGSKTALLQPSPTASGSDVKRVFDVRLLLAPLLLAVVVLGSFFGYRYFNWSSGTINSIAVLPFSNAAGDSESEFLAEGIAETLINNFTRIPELKVTARTTAFRFRGRDGEPQAVGRELGVGSMLTGRLTQRGDQLSVQVDLINTTDGVQIWGNRYEGKTSDLVSIQQRIATDVSSQLKLKLTGEQERQIARTYTQNSEAYQFYLRGRYHWNKRTADGLQKAIAEFHQAIERDPNYALGYVGLADSYCLLEEYAGARASETLPKAREAVDKALQIDDSLAEAHTTLAFIHQHQWRWAEAEQEFKRAIALNPNYPTAHHWLSIYFRIKRQFDDSLREIKRAQELDPFSPVISQNVASTYLTKNDINSAIQQWHRVIELDPNYPSARDNLGLAWLRQGRNEDALAEIQKAVELSARASIYLSDLGYYHAVTGSRAEALRILKELEARYPKRETMGQNLAKVYAGLGDKDHAFEWLERDFKERSGYLPHITWFFHFDNLRSDPRYEDLIRRMNLKQ